MPLFAGDGRVGVGTAREASHGRHQRWTRLRQTFLETTTTDVTTLSWGTGGRRVCQGLLSAERESQVVKRI